MRPDYDWREPVLTITGPFVLGPVLSKKPKRRIKPPSVFLFLLSAVAALTGVVFVLLGYKP